MNKPKPTKKVRTLEERATIVKEVESNPTETRISIAKRLGLPVSTLNSIVKARHDIRENIAKCGVSAKKR